MSLSDAERLMVRLSLVVISIREGAALPAHLKIPEDQVLRINFHDPDPAIELYPDRLEVFNQDHARRFQAWVRQWHDHPDPVDVVIHCRSGITRAVAVALYVRESTDARSHVRMRPEKPTRMCFAF